MASEIVADSWDCGAGAGVGMAVTRPRRKRVIVANFMMTYWSGEGLME